jgi:hypothetical protein
MCLEASYKKTIWKKYFFASNQWRKESDPELDQEPEMILSHTEHEETISSHTELGLAISDKKIIPRKTEKAEKLVYSDGIPPVPRNAKNLGIPFRNHSAEEKNARNSVPWNKLEAKLSKFRSEPFRGRENNSEFRSVEHG